MAALPSEPSQTIPIPAADVPIDDDKKAYDQKLMDIAEQRRLALDQIRQTFAASEATLRAEWAAKTPTPTPATNGHGHGHGGGSRPTTGGRGGATTRGGRGGARPTEMARASSTSTRGRGRGDRVLMKGATT